MTKAPNLTVEERILLHLYANRQNGEEFECSPALVQDGIAAEVGVSRSAIPRTVKRMKTKGLLTEEVRHVRGMRRRRKVYQLTREGLVAAKDLWDGVTSLEITVDGDVKKLGDLVGGSGENDSVLGLLARVGPKGELGPPGPSVDTTIPKEGSVEYPSSGKRDRFLPKIWMPETFVGRKDELEGLVSWLKGQHTRTAVVFGIPGIGKTTLAVKVWGELIGERPGFWLRLHQWDTLRGVIDSLWDFLTTMDPKGPLSSVPVLPDMEMSQLAPHLETSLKRVKPLMVFDDVHLADPSIINLISFIREILETQDAGRMLITSRSLIPVYDRRDVMVKRVVGEIHLKGLDEKSSLEMLRNRGIGESDIKRLVNLTGGHPLWLELIDPGEDLGKTKNVDLYIKEEVFTRLGDGQKRALQVLSLYRHPISPEGLYIDPLVNYEVVDDLARRTLLEEGPEGLYMHDLLQEFFSQTLSGEDLKNVHRRIAGHYLKKAEALEKGVHRADIFEGARAGEIIRTTVEGMYHLSRAGDIETVAKLAIDKGETLVGGGYFEEFLTITEGFDLDRMSSDVSTVIQGLVADATLLGGDLDGALSGYDTALSVVDNDLERASLMRRRARVFERKEDWDEAVEQLKSSLELAEKISDHAGTTECQGRLGWIYWKKGDYEKADLYHRSSMESAEMISDMPSRTRTYLEQAVALARQGDMKYALRYFEKGMAMLERSEGFLGRARRGPTTGDHYLQVLLTQFTNWQGKMSGSGE